jgi:hypothetical protein
MNRDPVVDCTHTRGPIDSHAPGAGPYPLNLVQDASRRVERAGMSTSTDSWVGRYDQNDRVFERRIGTRVPVEGVEVTWRAVSRERRRPGTVARVVDLSVTGIGLVAAPGVPAGSTMELEHAGGRALVDVRWSEAVDPVRARYGCAFAALDDAFEDWVHRVVANRDELGEPSA